MSNYPDDIRKYDNDPRSPFYVETYTHCEQCEKKLDEEEGVVEYEDSCFCSHDCKDEFIEDLDNEEGE